MGPGDFLLIYALVSTMDPATGYYRTPPERIDRIHEDRRVYRQNPGLPGPAGQKPGLPDRLHRVEIPELAGGQSEPGTPDLPVHDEAERNVRTVRVPRSVSLLVRPGENGERGRDGRRWAHDGPAARKQTEREQDSMTKSIAIRYSLAYLIMWAILGVVVLENAPGGDLTQAGLLKGVIMFHAAVAMTAAMEALARAAWSRLRDVRQRQRREDPNR